MRGIALEGVPTVPVHDEGGFDQSRDAKLERLDAMLNAAHNDGWTTDTEWEWSPGGRPRAIAALLKSADGLMRTVVVPFPPPHDIRRPICKPLASFSAPDTVVTIRRYALRCMERDDVMRRSRAIYEEVL